MLGRASDLDRLPRLRTTWVRRQYYVEAGFIRPALGSAIEEYDPFDAGYYAADTLLNGQPMYTALWNLDIKDEKAIRDFACSWGLLGLFQHCLDFSQYLAVSDGENMDLRVLGPGEASDRYFEITERPNSTYREYFALINPDPHHARTGRDKSHEAELERERQLFLTRKEWGSVFVRTCFNAPRLDVPLGGVAPPLDGPTRWLPLEAYYGQYFPDGHYPSLTSTKLWDYLCEPIDLLRSAVRDFRGIYGSVVRTGDVKDPIRLLQLNAHLSGVRPVVVPSRGDGAHLSMGWTFPSLLSVAYTMLCRDLSTPGRYPRLCDKQDCGRAFVTDRSDRRYCSTKCGIGERVRRLRARSASKRLSDLP